MRISFLAVVGWSIVIAGCAARGPRPALVAEAASADATLRAGCYRCLEDALSVYERVAALPRAPERARRGAFEAALLLAIRDGELGLDPGPHLDRARRHGALVDPGTGLAPQAYFDAADLVVGELSGLDPEARRLKTRLVRAAGTAAPPMPPARLALEGAAAGDLLAAYLALSIDCENPFARVQLDGNTIRARHADAPLIRFKLASCGAEPLLLAPLREQDARFADTLFFEGRREMTMQPVADVLKAVELFAAAREAFPASHAIVLALATAQNALGEYAAALASFDSVLAVEREHRDAMLGRLLSLSYLNRHTEAVAAATRLIDLGTWHVGDAYYWRAWNRYHIYALESGWSDVEQATKLLMNTSVYTLAGFIAFARKELDVAIERFDRAYVLDGSNCEAVWTAGLVHVEQQAWAPAAPKFATATACFAAAAGEARSEIERTRASNYAESVKARRIAGAQKRIDTAEHRQAQSAYNAASCYLRLGQRGAALAHLEVAIGHPLLREKAAVLKPAIDRLP